MKTHATGDLFGLTGAPPAFAYPDASRTSPRYSAEPLGTATVLLAAALIGIVLSSLSVVTITPSTKSQHSRAVGGGSGTRIAFPPGL